MLVDGKGDALGIAECARISSICAGAPWFTICTSWLVPLISRMPPDFLTGALGEPGAGKTTLLLELARTLLNRAENDDRERIPVVLTLSSWGRNRQPLATWLVDELKHIYMVRKSVAKSWIHNDRLILLLDGLDEVRPTSVRTLCIEAINAHLQKYPFASIVVCCRQKEYLSQQTYLQLHHAVSIQPLTPQQIEEYVRSLG